ncbi:hypothetical protein Cyrtocomes_01191 [Candidatus Cyrtobacter comes]|uniref:Uncharacterized protein n=1 Tax=Candidatus Cyrtobacter comes TaxID=675776 RepID=A0ABU5L9K1_9RICK|nr:hypothetical protein [Candidatus Cyrtobacter comes]MDZ5762796.1 hypothetical protein [Candidatus Cyrtobacter comes]
MNKKVILACSATLFYSASCLYAAKNENTLLSSFSYSANNNDPSVKLSASFSKLFAFLNYAYDHPQPPIDVLSASAMFVTSNNSDIGLELRYFANLEDQKPLSCSASFRYLFGYPNSRLRQYVKAAAGLYKQTFSESWKNELLKSGNELWRIDFLESTVSVVYAGIGIDFQIATNLFITAGIAADLQNIGNSTVTDILHNTNIILGIGIGFIF